MRVTLADVAQAAGVSVSTASRALTDSEHSVREETRQRVLRIAREVGYRPNLLARGLRGGQTFTVGIITESISDYFTSTIVRGIHDHLRQAGYSSTIVNCDGDPGAEADAIRTLTGRPTDGVILVDTHVHSSSSVLPEGSFPYVFVNRRAQSEARNCFCVVPANRQGARTVVEHLVGLGHRRIGYVNGPDGWEASAQRLAGYQDVLRSSGIALDPALVRTGDWSMDGGYEAAHDLLISRDPPTAIFAANDEMAVGVMYCAVDMGVNVPEDVAIVGFDDKQLARFVRPALTTLHMPLVEMGDAAAQLLLDQLAGDVIRDKGVEVPGYLIVRESCGARRVGSNRYPGGETEKTRG